MWLPEEKRWFIPTETHARKSMKTLRKKTFVHIRAYKYTPTWKSPAHIHANTVTHILRISGVPLGHALGRNHTHNTVVVFLPPGAVIGSGVADSLGRLRMSSLNHDGKGHLLLRICFLVFAQNKTFTIEIYTQLRIPLFLLLKLVSKLMLYSWSGDQGQPGNPLVCVRV